MKARRILFALLFIMGFALFAHGQGFLTLDQVNNHKSFTYTKELRENPDSVISLTLEDLKTIPDDISKFRNLHRIEFYFCLEMDINKELKKLSTLQNIISIVIYNGENTAAFPDQILNFKQLKDLHISGWKFKQIPEAIGNLTNLENLSFGSGLDGGCDLESLPKNISKLTHLKSLNLWGNLEIKLGDEFYGLHQLEELCLTWVSFDTKRVFESFGNLRDLSISGTEAESLDGISNLTHLKSLTVDYPEKLKTLGNDFVKLDSLEYFYFYFFPTTYNLDEMTKLSELSNLTTFECMIDKGCTPDFPFPKTGFPALKKLKISTLSEVEISDVVKKISSISSLEDLSLNMFKTTKLPTNLFNLKQLKKLTLNRLPLEELDGNFKKLNVETLNIYNIHIESLPRDLLKMKNLKHIELSRTKIKRSDDFLMELRNNDVKVKLH